MDNLLHHIISGGIKHLDNSLAMGCDNMLDFPLDNDFDCTPAMDAMSRDEIAAIVKESGKDAQAVLWARHEEALLARIAARGTKRRNRAAALV